MALLRRLTSAFLLSGAIAPLASAQTPPTTTPAPGPAASQAPAARGPQATRPRTSNRRSAFTPTQSSARRRSIVHHYPYPYPNYYTSDRTAGFRNPGGVGRYSEYYPPGDRF